MYNALDYHTIYSKIWELHSLFTLCCCVLIVRFPLILPISLKIILLEMGNNMIVPMSVKQSCKIWVTRLYELSRNSLSQQNIAKQMHTAIELTIDQYQTTIWAYFVGCTVEFNCNE